MRVILIFSDLSVLFVILIFRDLIRTEIEEHALTFQARLIEHFPLQLLFQFQYGCNILIKLRNDALY